MREKKNNRLIGGRREAENGNEKKYQTGGAETIKKINKLTKS